MSTINTYKMFGELMAESVGDNKIDNMTNELRRSADVEISTFVVTLLNTAYKSFAARYENPEFEGFREIMRDIRTRYRVMDGVEKEDLFNKIEGVFKDIFMKSFAACGPETAELVAGRYAQQMIEVIKREDKNPNAAISDLHLDNRKVNPRGFLPYDSEVKIDVQIDNAEANKLPIPGFRNVY